MKNLRNCFNSYKDLPRSIYLLFFASIVNNMGNFVAPFLTMFLTYRAHLNIGMVGVIVAVNAGLSMMGTMLGGKLIDSIGRKQVLVTFGAAAGIGYGLCAFINNPILITCILMLSSFLGGFSAPVYSTITTDLTEGSQRSAAFSLNYMSLNIGFSVGPLLAGFLYENYLMWFFLGDALTTLASIALVALFVPETKPTKEILEKSKVKTFESAEEGSLFTALLKRPTLLIFSSIMIIYFIVFSQFTFGLSIQVGDIFKNNSSTIFGSLMTVNAVLCSLLTVFITSATKKLKASLCIAMGGLLYMVGFGMMFFISTYYMFIVSTIIWTLGEILVANNTSVYIASHTPITHRGRFNSVFPIIRKLGFMLGPILAGFYIKFTTIRNLWLFIGILALVGTLMMYKLYTSDNIKAEVVETTTA